MKKITFLAAALVLAGCASKPAPQQTELQMPVTQAPAGARAPQVAEPAPAPQPPEIMIPGGTQIRVRLNGTLDTRRNRSGDRFTATLVTPIEENGQVVVPIGTTFAGHVTIASPSGRLKGRAVLGITLDSFR